MPVNPGYRKGRGSVFCGSQRVAGRGQQAKGYNSLMLSTGGFFAARYTGSAVAASDTSTDIQNITAICSMPKLSSSSAIVDTSASLLITPHRINEATVDKTKQMSAINPPSEKKILNTSSPLAPTARKTPISFLR